MSKERSLGFIAASIIFSFIMNLPWDPGLGLFALAMIVLPIIFALSSLIIYFLVCAFGSEFRLLATILACGVNVYCGLMLRLELPIPFE